MAERRGPRICVVGSRSLTSRSAIPFLSYILSFDEPSILLRSSRSGQRNEFEMACQIMAMMLNIQAELFKPEEGGRAAVFYRDIEMVSKADVVLCVFSADNPMEGGTAHVVEKAQDRRVPVYAYTDDGSGTWTRLGEWDPDDSWATRVPAG